MGQTFARTELKAMLATIVGRLELSMDDPSQSVDIEPGFILRPRDVMIRAKAVDAW